MSNKSIFLNNLLVKKKSFKKIFKKNKQKTLKEFAKLEKVYKSNSLKVIDLYSGKYKFNFNPTELSKFQKYKNVIVIGMGGSALGSKCIYSLFKNRIKKNFFFIDNLDTEYLKFLIKKKIFNNSCFIIVSKSGNTLETIVNLNVKNISPIKKENSIFITEKKDNSISSIAKKIKAKIFYHNEFIGGRYSVLSEVGMIPSLLMNIKYKKFFKNINFFNKKKNKNLIIDNVARLISLYQCGFKINTILNYNPILNDLGYWYQQLQAESLGKKNKGITPIVSNAPKDQHSLFQLYLDGPKDKFFTIINLSNKKKSLKISNSHVPKPISFIKNKTINFIVSKQCKACRNVFKNNGLPFRYFIINGNSEEDIGFIFSFFVLETILLGKLLKVNPFDQPAVEDIKIETKKNILK